MENPDRLWVEAVKEQGEYEYCYLVFAEEEEKLLQEQGRLVIRAADISATVALFRRYCSAFSLCHFVALSGDDAEEAWAQKLASALLGYGIRCDWYRVRYETGNLPLADILRCGSGLAATYLPMMSNRLLEDDIKRRLTERLSSGLDALTAKRLAHPCPQPTGWGALDRQLGGGLYCGLIAIGGVPACGKTAFVQQLADYAASNGRDVLFVSLEMSRVQLVARSIARLASTHDHAISAIEIEHSSEDEHDAKRVADAMDIYRDKIDKHMMIYEAEKAMSSNDVAYVAEQVAKVRGVAPLVILDYLQILSIPDGCKSDKEGVDRNVMTLKHLANKLGTQVVAITSFNRDSYRKETSMEALKESGGIEYGADVAMGFKFATWKKAQKTSEGKLPIEIFNYYKTLDTRPLELVIFKNRNGRDGVVRFLFEPKKMSFREPTVMFKHNIKYDEFANIIEEIRKHYDNNEGENRSTINQGASFLLN